MAKTETDSTFTGRVDFVGANSLGDFEFVIIPKKGSARDFVIERGLAGAVMMQTVVMKAKQNGSDVRVSYRETEQARWVTHVQWQ